MSLTGSPDYLWQFGLIAIGSAYLMPLESGDQLSAAELNALGRNVSKIHTDMMFSSAEVSIMALARDGR